MNTEINNLKSSVSNGKAAVASAITDKGVSTSATASFSTMASNIRSIPNGLSANTRYASKSLGTWNTQSDVDNFLSRYNHNNNYAINDNDFLSLGNYVTINDGTYNTQWVIAGFDLEHNATASDGTTYDNGYGILMIPKTPLTTGAWNASSTAAVPYINSTMHTSTLVTAANNMKRVLGDHMINRNVLLGSAQNSQVSYSQPNTTSAYTWTKSYLTLMSIGQMNGISFAQTYTKYDDGEANYKLSLFDHEDYSTSSMFWSRCVWGFYNGSNFSALVIGNRNFYSYYVSDAYGVRPLMLLR